MAQPDVRKLGIFWSLVISSGILTGLFRGVYALMLGIIEDGACQLGPCVLQKKLLQKLESIRR